MIRLSRSIAYIPKGRKNHWHRRDSGCGGSKDHKLKIKNMKIEGSIKEGDEVYTSGLTSVPEGIKIGKIKNIKKDELELEYILDIESISLHNLKYLGVISL